MKRLLAGEDGVIYGDGVQSRDFVYVGDVVAANLVAFRKKAAGVFNIGTGIETTVNALYDEVATACGTARPARREAGKPGEQRRSVLDVSRAAAAPRLHRRRAPSGGAPPDGGVVPGPGVADGLTPRVPGRSFGSGELPPDDDDGLVVLRGRLAAEEARRQEDPLDDLRRGPPFHLDEQPPEPARPELAPLRVVRLRDPVGVEADEVARLHPEAATPVGRVRGRAEDHPRRRELVEDVLCG